jgi:hypothetical protein
MPRPKGSKNSKPYAVSPGKADRRFKPSLAPTGRTEAIAGRVSTEVHTRLEAEGRSLNWGERIERAVQRLIRLENVSANTADTDDFAF